MVWVPKLERLLVIAGLMALGIYLGARLHEAVFLRLAVRSFQTQQSAASGQRNASPPPTKAPDFTLWSVQRIREYNDSLAVRLAPTLALLRIPRLRLEVPVFSGTSELTLNQGVGLIEGTSLPGEDGNIGIAGHRDGFFRVLKNAEVGDQVDLVSKAGTDSYFIDRIVIVQPEDVSVLHRRAHPSLTLVTCYPFYFIGSAPQRFIVQASLRESKSDGSNVSERVGSQPKTAP